MFTITKREILDSIYFFFVLIVLIFAFFNTQLGLLLGFILMAIYVPFAVISHIYDWHKIKMIGGFTNE